MSTQIVLVQYPSGERRVIDTGQMLASEWLTQAEAHFTDPARLMEFDLPHPVTQDEVDALSDDDVRELVRLNIQGDRGERGMTPTEIALERYDDAREAYRHAVADLDFTGATASAVTAEIQHATAELDSAIAGLERAQPALAWFMRGPSQ